MRNPTKTVATVLAPDVKIKNEKNRADQKPYKIEIVWRNVIIMVILHGVGLYGIIHSIIRQDSSARPVLWFWFLGIFGGFGILSGAHRLWCHRSYKAKWPLRLILMLADTLALQNDLYEWCRDHRVHHKYSETDADPHNANRGFFFSHMGWLFCKKHPEVKAKGKTVDLSDLWEDPLIRFQRRFYIPMVLLVWGVFPVWVPVYFWGENVYYMICYNMFRYVFSLHQTWFVNSFAHLNGMKPYDKYIGPTENRKVVYATMGEGYHNYHHTFPWDYSASELGWEYNFNPATAFIEFFAKMGWAYDLKRPSIEMIRKRKERTGDPTDVKVWVKPRSWWVDFICGMLMIFWIAIFIFGARLAIQIVKLLI